MSEFKENSEAASVAEYLCTRLLIETKTSEIADLKHSTALTPIPTDVAISEAQEALERAGKKILAIKRAEITEFKNQRRAQRAGTLNAPVGSMVRHSYNITINYVPSAENKEHDVFEVIGDVCDVNFGNDVLTSSYAEAKIPKKAKLDILAFDRMVERVATELPKLVLTMFAEEEKNKCLEILDQLKASRPFGNAESFSIDEESGEDTETE